MWCQCCVEWWHVRRLKESNDKEERWEKSWCQSLNRDVIHGYAFAIISSFFPAQCFIRRKLCVSSLNYEHFYQRLARKQSHKYRLMIDRCLENSYKLNWAQPLSQLWLTFDSKTEILNGDHFFPWLLQRPVCVQTPAVLSLLWSHCYQETLLWCLCSICKCLINLPDVGIKLNGACMWKPSPTEGVWSATPGGYQRNPLKVIKCSCREYGNVSRSGWGQTEV